MGKAGGALVGALAIGGVCLAVGATHSVFVPVRLAGGQRPAPTDATPADTDPGDPAATENGTEDAATQTDEAPRAIGIAEGPGPESPAQPESGYRYIGLDEAKAMWDEFTAAFVDARPMHLYEAGHIDGAYWMPASEVSAAMIFELVDMVGYDGQVVIYCTGGDCDASENVAIRLEEAGFTNLIIMRSGYDDWAAAGYETLDGPPPEIDG